MNLSGGTEAMLDERGVWLLRLFHFKLMRHRQLRAEVVTGGMTDGERRCVSVCVTDDLA